MENEIGVLDIKAVGIIWELQLRINLNKLNIKCKQDLLMSLFRLFIRRYGQF